MEMRFGPDGAVGLATKTEDLSLFLGAHTVEGENRTGSSRLSSGLDTRVYAHTNKYVKENWGG